MKKLDILLNSQAKSASFIHSPTSKTSETLKPTIGKATSPTSSFQKPFLKPTSSRIPLNENQKPFTRQKTARSAAQIPSPTSFSINNIKSSVKENGLVQGYAAGTHQGIVRNYNEDRVSIIFNINKPSNRELETWPKCSFFAVYDGHGGSTCADFLRDNLHQFITRSEFFPYYPEKAIEEGFELAERTFTQYARSEVPKDVSGSCAIVVLIVSDTCYIANLGDSRAILSSEKGKKVISLSADHKPNVVNERQRIESNGGSIYQSFSGPDKSSSIYRVFPGQLSMSRSFGDIDTKLEEFGGNPGVIIAVPDIKSFKIGKEFDFIIIGSDGIFDRMLNREAAACVYEAVNRRKQIDVHSMCELGVGAVMALALANRTSDNVTVIMIAFEGLLGKPQETNSD